MKMKPVALIILISLTLCHGAIAEAKSKSKKSKKTVGVSSKEEEKKTKVESVKATKTKSIESRMKEDLVFADIVDNRFYRFKLNTMLGMNIIQDSALLSGMQFGYAPFSSVPFYVGPEFNFSLFSPGNIFSLMATAWYGWKIQGAPKLTVSIGGSAGPGFNTLISYLPATPLVVLLDLAMAQDIDDLVSIRAQFRPGYIGNYFAFMMNFNVSYRFP